MVFNIKQNLKKLLHTKSIKYNNNFTQIEDNVFIILSFFFLLGKYLYFQIIIFQYYFDIIYLKLCIFIYKTDNQNYTNIYFKL